jgi:uncharacterized protein (DUF983 family)
MKYLEETLKQCKHCGKQTKHHRTNSKPGFGMILLHIILTVITSGLWLLLLLPYYLFTTKIGGWSCSECSN